MFFRYDYGTSGKIEAQVRKVIMVESVGKIGASYEIICDLVSPSMHEAVAIARRFHSSWKAVE